MIRRSPLKRGAPPKRSTKRIRPRNLERQKKEFARAYHSIERVEFVKSLPCVAGCLRPSQNAHIETGGAGRKADYDKIVPLCFYAHRLFHSWGRVSFEKHFSIDLDALAADTERCWRKRA